MNLIASLRQRIAAWVAPKQTASWGTKTKDQVVHELATAAARFETLDGLILVTMEGGAFRSTICLSPSAMPAREPLLEGLAEVFDHYRRRFDGSEGPRRARRENRL